MNNQKLEEFNRDIMKIGSNSPQCFIRFLVSKTSLISIRKISFLIVNLRDAKIIFCPDHRWRQVMVLLVFYQHKRILQMSVTLLNCIFAKHSGLELIVLIFFCVSCLGLSLALILNLFCPIAIIRFFI